MSFRRFGPGDELGELSRKIFEMMDQMGQRRYVEFRDVGAWQPNTNVYETDAAYDICVELAGVDHHKIDIHVNEQRHLTLCGQRPKPQCPRLPPQARLHAMEVPEGSFSRRIELPYAVDVARIEATYENGFLWIHVPKLAVAGEGGRYDRP